jgi:hypothetical protein
MERYLAAAGCFFQFGQTVHALAAACLQRSIMPSRDVNHTEQVNLTICLLCSSAEGAMSISVSTRSQLQRHEAARLGLKVTLVLVAIILFSLAVVALEVRVGAVPSDNAIALEFGGE